MPVGHLQPYGTQFVKTQFPEHAHQPQHFQKRLHIEPRRIVGQPVIWRRQLVFQQLPEKYIRFVVV